VRKRSQEIRGRILEYLNENQDAGGTLVDVVEYWLALQCVDESVEVVKEVLDTLLESGEIIRIKGGTTIYKTRKKG